MKNQLLEDIDDSQSEPSVPAVRGVQPARPVVRTAPVQRPEPSPRPETMPRPEVWSRRAPSIKPEAPAEEGLRQRAGVWRSRAASAPPEPAPARPPIPEAPRRAPDPVPDVASFASRTPDWAIPVPDDAVPWTERWGRKALGWGAGLALVAVLAGAGTWMFQETQVQSTLAMVADSVPPKVEAPPAYVAEEPAPLPLPPLRLLPRESVAPAAVALPEAAPAAGALPVPDRIAAAPAAAPPKPPAAAPKPRPKAKRPPERRVAAAAPAKRPPERRVAAATPAKRTPATQEKTRPARPRERIVAKAPAPVRAAAQPPVRPAPRPAPVPGEPAPQAESPLAETLRMCRAAGYHATACIKRGCEATRFGLACRG